MGHAAHWAMPRVAVLYSGALVWPNVEKVWPTHLEHLILPHAAAVFVFASADQVRLPSDQALPAQYATFRDATPRLVGRGGGSRANESVICGFVAQLIGPHLARCKVGEALVDGAPTTDPVIQSRPKRSAAVLQYSKLCQVDRLRRDAEADGLPAHDLVVRARLDMFLWQTVPMPLPRPRSAAWMLLTPPLSCHACARFACSEAICLADHLFVMSTGATHALCSFVRGTAIAELTRRKGRANNGQIEPQLLLHLADSGVAVSSLNLSAPTRLLSFDGNGYRANAVLWMIAQATNASFCVHQHQQRQAACRAQVPAANLYSLLDPAQTKCHVRQSALLRASPSCARAAPADRFVARAVRLQGCIADPNRTLCPFEAVQ